MKTFRIVALGALATTCLVGCGNNGYNNYPSNDNYSYNQSNPVGSISVVVTNTNLPANTAAVAYTVVDIPSGQTVFQQSFTYSGGPPATQLISNVPAENEQVTVQALDSANNVLLLAQSTVEVPDGGTVTDSVTLGADQATALVFTNGPFNVVAGATMPTVVVAETDANGNLAVGSTDTITLSLGTNPSSGTLGGTLTATAVNGIATFPGLTLGQAGNGYTLAATGTGVTSATSGGFNVLATAGTATQLVFSVQPFTTVGVNQVLSPAPQVVVEDGSGTVVNTGTAGVQLSLGTNSGNASLTGTTLVTTTQGIATFNAISLNAPGTGYTLSASSGGLLPATSSSFTVSN